MDLAVDMMMSTVKVTVYLERLAPEKVLQRHRRNRTIEGYNLMNGVPLWIDEKGHWKQQGVVTKLQFEKYRSPRRPELQRLAARCILKHGIKWRKFFDCSTTTSSFHPLDPTFIVCGVGFWTIFFYLQMRHKCDCCAVKYWMSGETVKGSLPILCQETKFNMFEVFPAPEKYLRSDETVENLDKNYEPLYVVVDVFSLTEFLVYRPFYHVFRKYVRSKHNCELDTTIVSTVF